MKISPQSGHSLGVLLMLGIAVAVVSAETPVRTARDDSRVLQENEQAWAKAGLDGDADRMAGYMADDYVELAWEPAAPGAPAHWTTVRGSEWLESVRSHKDVYTSVEVHDLTVHLQGSLAVVTGQYSQKGTSNGKDISATGIYANTWVKRNGRWMLVHSVFP